jgi:hypothetical protein
MATTNKFRGRSWTKKYAEQEKGQTNRQEVVSLSDEPEPLSLMKLRRTSAGKGEKLRWAAKLRQPRQ